MVLLVGYFFVRRQLSQNIPVACRFVEDTDFSLSVGTSVCSFVAQMLCWRFLCPSFGTLGPDEVGDGLLLTPLAVGDDDCGSFGREVDRTGSCRVVGWCGVVDIFRRIIFISCLPRIRFQRWDCFVYGYVWIRVRVIPDAE